MPTQREKLLSGVSNSLDQLVKAGAALLEDTDGSISETNSSYFGGHISVAVAALTRTADAITRLK
jgi:hypothetical protein